MIDHRHTARSPGHETLYCENGHEHVMAPEQIVRLEGQPCCWCKRPMMRPEALRALWKVAATEFLRNAEIH